MVGSSSLETDEFFEAVASPCETWVAPRLAIASFNGKVKICDAVRPHDVIKLPNHDVPVWCVACLSTGRVVSGGDDNLVRVWDPSNCDAALLTLAGHTDSIAALDCAVVSGSPCIVSGSFDTTVRVWQPNRHAESTVLRGHTDFVLAVACCFLGGALHPVSGARDWTVKVWDIVDRAPLATLSGHTNHVFGIVALDALRLASCSGDTTVRVWDVGTDGSAADVVVCDGHTRAVTAIAAYGNRLVSASKDTTLRVWDSNVGRCLATLRGHDHAVHAVQVFSVLQATHLVSGDVQGVVRIWDAFAFGPAKLALQAHAAAVTSIAVVAPPAPLGRRRLGSSQDFDDDYGETTSDGRARASSAPRRNAMPRKGPSRRGSFLLDQHRNDFASRSRPSSSGSPSPPVDDSPVLARSRSRSALFGTEATTRRRHTNTRIY